MAAVYDSEMTRRIFDREVRQTLIMMTATSNNL